MLFKKAPKVTQYLGYFFVTENLKIAQSGHTDYTSRSAAHGTKYSLAFKSFFLRKCKK